MRYQWLLCAIIVMGAGCTLTQSPPTAIPTPVVISTSALGLPTATAPSTAVRPIATLTLLPLPGAGASIVPPVTSVPILGARCEAYVTYSGVRSDNTLSLRSSPSTAATQVVRVPNNVEVWLVPGSVETEAEGYRWLNVVYQASPQLRYQGWIARDSFELNGVRDPSVATLRPAGRQVSC